MGRVYMAEVLEPQAGLPAGRTVAVKVLHSHLQHERESLARFLREARLGRRVSHENVVRTYDCDVADVKGEAHPYIVMQYVEGQTLRELLHELGRLPEELCRHVGREVARGLRAIHEVSVIHRDLKPDNVLITPKHEVMIMDLGVARLHDATTDSSQSASFVGSIAYASPEQFEMGGADVDCRTDLHALGLILYELATGRHPFRDEDAKAAMRRILEEAPRRAGLLNPQLSPFFEELIHTLLSKDPAQRFQTAHDLLRALEDRELSSWWIRRASALRLETRRPLRRVRIPRETALYGREAELADLQRTWTSVRAGEGQVLLIEGESGIGKTRLADEFVGKLLQEGEEPHFLFASYPPGGAATAAGAFSTAYREQFGPERLEDTLGEVLDSMPSVVPAFAALLRHEPPPEGVPRLTKETIQAAFVQATRRLAAEHPTIVMIDDLHFAPQEGRALFAALAVAIARHRVLLVGTMRRGVPEPWISHIEHLEHASRMRLQRLGPKDLVHLLKDAFRSDRLAEELGVKVALKSDGNPFFVFEIIRGLREDKAITQRPDGTWITTRKILELKVPSSVADLVQARIADLDDEERQLLEVAACCGFEFDGVLLAEATGAERIPTFRRLGHLEKAHRLVRSAGRGFVFDHHQVQEALYEGLAPVLREDYHRVLGETLERQAGWEEDLPDDLSGPAALALCKHFLAGAVPERAARYLDAALTHLERGYSHGRAGDLAAQVLAAPGLVVGRERVLLLLRRAALLDLPGRRDEQEAAVREALAIARGEADGELQAKALSQLGAVLGLTGRYDEAAQALEEARAVARIARALTIEALAAGNLGIIRATQGRHRDAMPLLERALEVSRSAGERVNEIRAHGNLGNSLLALGRLQEARDAFEQQLALARQVGDAAGEAYASGCLGTVFLRTGRHDEAREYFERQMELDRAVGNRRGESVAHSLLAGACLSLGRYEEARLHGERQLEIAQEIGDRWGEGRATAVLANVAGDLGRYAEARARARAWLDITREIGDRLQEGWALHMLAVQARMRGEFDAAIGYLEEALPIRRAQQDVFGEAADHLTWAGVLADRGDAEGALRELDDAIADAREADVPGVLMVAVAHRALVAQDDPTEALEAVGTYGERSTVLSRLAAWWFIWRVTGDPLHLEKAHALLESVCEHAPADMRTSAVENVPLHRGIDTAWRNR